ncbi:nicotinate phosphoribosyltransferase [Blattabacterium cuenoti]|uniref:nicotinate phosphoribosyltransferase n=1 Tax=Blattabacterium cuenoti TaxID=1653831 RepID=UPI00163C381D|nr:nicotinate phosphoribosyltransferase [Blattabacterium cuenoti]
MNNISIISSLLDNDFYKFTMQNAVIKLFPLIKTKYKFINRGKYIFPKNFSKVLKENLDKMAYLKLSNNEKIFLKKFCPCLDNSYLNFLKKYQYNPKEVKIYQNGSTIKMNIEGLWSKIILWEVPLMAIISELYYKMIGIKRLSNNDIIKITKEKINKYKKMNIKVGEYGTRRRFSYKIHKLILKILVKEGNNSFIGSSNVHLSKIFSKKPIGTQGHEWIMFHAAKYGFNIADQISMENWLKIYNNKKLNIALSDTYTSSIFFKNFNKKLSNIYEGIRHDSGDPINFIKETINHYKNFKINPMKKKIIFSDNLDPNKIKHILSFCKKKINPIFCIGTNFTNDVGVPPMNIVIKMTKVLIKKKWIPVVKLSNSKEKYTGEKKMISIAKKMIHLL